VKAKIRALITLSILCVFLALAYVLLPSGKSARGAQANVGQSLVITDFHVSELLALAISNGYGPFGILNNPEGVAAVSDIVGSFSAAQMRAIIYLACNLTGIRRLDSLPEPEDITKSLSFFTLILTGDREYVFALLRKSPVSEDYLLFSQEHQAIFLIPESDAQWFLRSAEDFLE